MPKSILFFADGTWSGPDRDDNDGVSESTNVYKLYYGLNGRNVSLAEYVDSANEKEKILAENGQVSQVAKYIHGVGDTNNPIRRILGGVFGAGLISRIVRGYTYISRNYEQGDNIILVGFSRGAYTVRALAGLIASEGLLRDSKWLSKEDAYRMGIKVWRNYRGRLKHSHNIILSLMETTIEKIDYLNHVNKDDLVPVGHISAVAVWDTVGALGIPEYYKDKRMDLFKFADNVLNQKVHYGFHAVALDEQREDFTPSLWKRRENVVQMVFPGAHSDVGGGYSTENNESGLSDITLQWMAENLKSIGVSINTPLYLPFNPDVRGVAHKPWLEEPFNKLGVRVRNFKGAAVLGHDAIALRMSGGPVKNAPFESPQQYKPSNWSVPDIAKQLNSAELNR